MTVLSARRLGVMLRGCVCLALLVWTYADPPRQTPVLIATAWFVSRRILGAVDDWFRAGRA